MAKLSENPEAQREAAAAMESYVAKAAFPPSFEVGHQLTAVDGSQWTIEYFFLANLQGNSDEPIPAVHLKTARGSFKTLTPKEFKDLFEIKN